MVKEKILKAIGGKLIEKSKEIFAEESENRVKGIVEEKIEEHFLKLYREKLDEELLEKYGDELFYDDLCKALLNNDNITKLLMRCKKRDLMDSQTDEEFIDNILQQLPANVHYEHEVRKILEYIYDVTFKCFNELENADSDKLANIVMHAGDVVQERIIEVKKDAAKILQNQNQGEERIQQGLNEIKQLLGGGNRTNRVSAFKILDKNIREGKIKEVKELISEGVSRGDIVCRAILFEVNCLHRENILVEECSELLEHIVDEEILNRIIEFVIMIKIDDKYFLQQLEREKCIPDVYRNLLHSLIVDDWDEIVKVERENKRYNIQVVCDGELYEKYKEIINYMIYHYLFNRQELEGRLSNFDETAIYFIGGTNFLNDLELMRLKCDGIISYSITIPEHKMELLNQLLDKVILQIDLWNDIAVNLSVKYYELYFRLLLVLRKEGIQERYLEIPTGLQERVEIKFYWILDRIYKGTISERDIIEFAIEEKGYNALTIYCELNKNDSGKIIAVLDQCKLLLRKDVNLFCFYVKALFNKGAYDEARCMIEDYREVYLNNLKYWNVCLSLKTNVDLVGVYNDFVSGKVKMIDFNAEEEFIEHLYNNDEYDRAYQIINQLETLQISSYKVGCIKADILLKMGRDLEALEIFRLLYQKNPNNIAVIERILRISIINRRKISDDIVRSATQICEPWSDAMLSKIYELEGENEKADFYITRGLLKCHSFQDNIYGQYIGFHLLAEDDRIIQSIKGVDINTAVILQSEQTSMTICIFEKRYVTEKNQTWEGAKIIDKDEAIKIGLLRMKTGESINIKGNSFVIDQIMPVDCFLVRTCFTQLENHNISKSYSFENKEDVGQDFVKWLTDNFPKRVEVNFLEEYIHPKGLPVPLYVLHHHYPLVSFGEMLIALLDEKNIMIRNICCEEEIAGDSDYVMSYSVLVMLWKMGVTFSDVQKGRIYVPSSIKVEAENEAHYIQENVNRDVVARMNVIENQLFFMEDTEDVKRTRMKNVTCIKEYVNQFPDTENITDIEEYQNINSENIKMLIGVCDYDAIAISSKEEKCLVAEEAILSYLSKSSNIKCKVINIVDFLVNIKIDCGEFIQYITRLVDYTFEDFITKKGVEYIADSVCSGVGDNQTIINQWVTFLNMEEQLEEGYKTVFACTLGRICKELHDKYKDRENPIWKLLLYYVWSWFCYNESESEDI